MTDPTTPAEVGEAAENPTTTHSWAQPPAPAERAAGRAQPTSGAPRTLHGATRAAQWQPPASLPDQPRTEPIVEPPVGAAPPLGLTPVRSFTPTVQVCPKCGGDVDFDGYCMVCGTKAPSVRDHFEESPADWVGGVCDRGIRHTRNEDALAVQASPGPGGHAVLVVCDGVSTSTDSDQASLAAARAAAGYIVGRGGWDWDLADIQAGSAARALIDGAARVANEAVLDNSDLTGPNPASCTLAIGLAAGRRLVAATVGDSRVYWLPDSGAAILLSTDDSVAQEQIAAGMAREIAEGGIHGHIITRWLGRDAPSLEPTVAGTLAEGPGWLLVCSDGLWNFASDPAALGRIVSQLAADGEPEPLSLARALVAWANEQGGHDNVTAVLARIDEPPAVSPAPPVETSIVNDIPTTRTRPTPAVGTTPAS